MKSVHVKIRQDSRGQWWLFRHEITMRRLAEPPTAEQVAALESAAKSSPHIDVNGVPHCIVNSDREFGL